MQTLITPPPHDAPSLPYEEQVDHAREALPADLPDDPSKVLVALDVDGTLVTANGASENVRRTVASSIEAGINVVIATGRGVAATRSVFQELELPSGFSVSSNGAQIVRWERAQDGRHVYEKLSETYFDPRAAVQAVLGAIPGTILGADGGDERMRVNQYFPPGELASVEDLHELEELLSFPTLRMVVRAPWLTRVEFEDALTSVDLSSVECAIGWTSWADLTAHGTTKAKGLETLVSDLGIDRRGTIAVGDGTNDIAMLEWAAHGVAMGTATPDIIAAANTTTGAVDHDGAAAVLDALLERY